MSDEQKPQAEIHDEASLQNDQDEQLQGQTVEEALEEQDSAFAELEAQLAEANNTINQQKEAVLRARADMENAKRRAETEVEKARKFALEKFASELLPVADNLERAMQVADAENEMIKPIVEGVDLTLKSLVSTLEKFGLTIVDPTGQSFNPEQHQAMSLQESSEFPANTVMAVMQKGYLLNGRLLRPAMVMVSKAPEGGSSSSVNTEA